MSTGTMAGLLVIMAGFALLMMEWILRGLAEQAQREGHVLDSLVDHDFADQFGCWGGAILVVGIVIVVLSSLVALVQLLV